MQYAKGEGVFMPRDFHELWQAGGHDGVGHRQDCTPSFTLSSDVEKLMWPALFQEKLKSSSGDIVEWWVLIAIIIPRVPTVSLAGEFFLVKAKDGVKKR